MLANDKHSITEVSQLLLRKREIRMKLTIVLEDINACVSNI
jgi:hypothetical protein